MSHVLTIYLILQFYNIMLIFYHFLKYSIVHLDHKTMSKSLIWNEVIGLWRWIPSTKLCMVWWCSCSYAQASLKTYLARWNCLNKLCTLFIWNIEVNIQLWSRNWCIRSLTRGIYFRGKEPTNMWNFSTRELVWMCSSVFHCSIW